MCRGAILHSLRIPASLPLNSCQLLLSLVPAGQWRAFSGNELGAMLAEWVLRNHRRRAQEAGACRPSKQCGWVGAVVLTSLQQPPCSHTSTTNAGADPGRLAVLSSTVSSRMLAAIASAEGVHWRETLTGFKWLGNEGLALEAQGWVCRALALHSMAFSLVELIADKLPGSPQDRRHNSSPHRPPAACSYTVLFAFEEAIGFMFGAVGHDKDGVAAAAVFGELAADVYARGSTLVQHWAELQRRYGAFEYRRCAVQASLPLVRRPLNVPARATPPFQPILPSTPLPHSGYFIADPPSKSEAVFRRLRASVPLAIGGCAVRSVRDLGTGVDTSRPGEAI